MGLDEGESAVGLFDVVGSPADLARARQLLKRDGFVPTEDESGHRGAVQLWRDHASSRTRPTSTEVAERVDQLLAQPLIGLAECVSARSGKESLGWVRPADVAVNGGKVFPYHYSYEELVGSAQSLLTERGDPQGMARILGSDYSVIRYAAPHGPLYRVYNGNHRTVMIQAAGFPVAMACVQAVEGPWLLNRSSRQGDAYLRALAADGWITVSDLAPRTRTVETSDYGHLLLSADAATARHRVVAYEERFGRQLEVPDWLRDEAATRRRLRRARWGRPLPRLRRRP